MVIPVLIQAHWVYAVSGEFRIWLKLLGMLYNMELLLIECLFAVDHQNPEKSARHLMTVSKKTEGAEHPRPQV